MDADYQLVEWFEPPNSDAAWSSFNFPLLVIEYGKLVYVFQD